LKTLITRTIPELNQQISRANIPAVPPVPIQQ